jgi:hypothetical protein
MLVAVTVLAVISLLLARIVSQTNNITFDGTRQAAQNASARLAMEQFNTDFIQAFAHGRVGFQWEGPDEPHAYAYDVFPCDRIRFAAALNTPEPYDESAPDMPPINERIREAVRVCYYVTEMAGDPGVYSLMRATSPVFADTYVYPNVWNPTDRSSSEYELMRYVVEFRTTCVWTNGAAFPAGIRPELPVYVDLFLAVLSESDVRQARTFTDTYARRDFIIKRAQRYHLRCVALRRNVYLGGRW